MELPSRRQRGSQKRRFTDLLKEDVQRVWVRKEYEEDRHRWRMIISCGKCWKVGLVKSKEQEEE